MKILKFGGTSVGSAARIKSVAELVNNPEPKIVVLSAMSGTTNALVEINNLLYSNKKDEAKTAIHQLHEKYKTVIGELYSTQQAAAKATACIDEIFTFMRSFSLGSFSDHAERGILAQGEILSTNLFQFYLQYSCLP
ncbi:MAG: hypothetical protein EOP53_11815 [Sphingobacteriales bacterium]|nr:MAG: hypothetical protein EOP53_11815 [Sphingobacteriales bacterium]